MKRIIFGIFLLTLALSSCDGQSNKEINNDNTNKSDSINKPKTEVHVNKVYDDEGNLVRYDSTYSYYYSNIENNPQLEDSIMSVFREQLKNNFNFSSDPFFEDLFFQDSLLKYDFYNNDFFIERFKHNKNGMNDLFREMDSIKNEFFEKQFKKKMIK